MKDNVLDLLIYLFENYMSADDEPRPDRNTLKLELDKAGFAEPDIERALEWLDGLSGEQLGKVAEATARAVRVFSSQELVRLDTDVRGYLMYLENVRILSGTERELVIDRLMALEADEMIRLAQVLAERLEPPLTGHTGLSSCLLIDGEIEMLASDVTQSSTESSYTSA